VSGVPKVFVNYRVREQAGYAALLHRELAARFGLDNVFLASRSIRPGEDFVQRIRESLRQCLVLLAVMGPHWLESGGGITDVGGFDADHDWVHWEIAEAFARGIRVVPVLIEDADLPGETSLPVRIARLARCQYVRLRHHSIDGDIAQLVDVLRRTVPALEPRVSEPVADLIEPRYLQLARAPRRSQCRIGIFPGAIRRVRKADIWVNSENTDMQMARCTEFSVSAIIRYWGSTRDDAGRVQHDLIADELDAAVGANRPVAPGTAVVTSAGALTSSNNVRYIIHVAAVQGEPGAGFRQVRNIGWCVTNALMQAERLAQADPAVRTILFPLLGTGVAGAMIEATANAILLAAVDYLAQRPDTLLNGIFLLAYSRTEFAVLDSVWRTLPLRLIEEA
jgi:O-acetyl-ADP-ribose deacetylase (regulator of RNase III)